MHINNMNIYRQIPPQNQQKKLALYKPSSLYSPSSKLPISKLSKMINILGLCVVISSLVSAAVWSPTPQKHNSKEEDVIVKDGHRVVVVEYDQQGQHNTKVSISPEHDNYYHHHIIPKPTSPSLEEKISSAASDVLDNARDRIKEASSVLPNLGQGLSGDHHGPGDLICDAHGKCTHKIASAIEKAKGKVSEKAHGAAEMLHEAKEEVKEAAHEAATRKKEMAYEAKEKVQDVLSKAKEGASHKADNAKESIVNLKETAAEKAQDVKEGVDESLSKAKGVAKEAKDIGKTIGKDVAHNVTKQVGKVRDSAVEKAKEAKEGSEEAARRTKSSLNQVLNEIGQIFSGLMRYLGLPDAMDALMGVMNLLGFAMAYGMCVWVTFISSYVLAGALPRQQFGIVQSKIYPVYFRAMAGSVGLALLGHMPRLFGTKPDMFQGANLLGSILMVLANSMYLEPRATKVMFERMKVEKEEGRGREGIVPETSRAAETTTTTTTEPAVQTTHTTTTATRPQENPEQEVVRSKLNILSERLKKLNTYSSILNILTLMSLSWHLVYLGQRLHMVC